MKYIILCGGVGKRCNQYSLPKPLNYVAGKHMIEYVIESIPSDEIYIIYNAFLAEYHFEQVIINLFKERTIRFSKVDYLTRGAVESAYVGINGFHLGDDSIVFLDNDNLHNLHNLNAIQTSFIGYGKDYEKTNFSFIEISNGNVVNIEEKVKISDDYCCGIYGFKSARCFNEYAQQLLELNYKTKNEFYFSQLYKLLIANNETILPVQICDTRHIGTYDEIVNSVANFEKAKKLRICFDLDNTLVTFPTVPYDYSSVKPIGHNIRLLQKLKADGHEIIIHTARRMKTHNNNVGKVIKDIALVTIDTLAKFDVEYDELIFGKPLADIYIDDKGLNPYANNISFFGLFEIKDEYFHNKIPSNKYNSVKKYDAVIVKKGPEKYMRGELYFYQNIPLSLSPYFPTLKSHSCADGDHIVIHVDYVHGIPLFYLYKNRLVTRRVIDGLFDLLDKIHGTSHEINITLDSIHRNYFHKLEARFNRVDYCFDNAETVYKRIADDLERNYAPKLSAVVHGDFWFSNIMVDYLDNYKLIDMKGQVDGILTLNGDSYYDYGKLYQSILGYDLILNDCSIDHDYICTMETYFLDKCASVGLNIAYLKSVTKSLIFGTFHFIEDSVTKQRVWDFLVSIP
jgi:capsule biosynthesis phosphatase